MQITVRIPLLDRLVDRPQQDLQPLQAVVTVPAAKSRSPSRQEARKRSVGR